MHLNPIKLIVLIEWSIQRVQKEPLFECVPLPRVLVFGNLRLHKSDFLCGPRRDLQKKILPRLGKCLDLQCQKRSKQTSRAGNCCRPIRRWSAAAAAASRSCRRWRCSLQLCRRRKACEGRWSRRLFRNSFRHLLRLLTEKSICQVPTCK